MYCYTLGCPRHRAWVVNENLLCNACIRRMVVERDGPDCHYCGVHIPAGHGRLDHRLARSRGGRDWPENRVLACRHCDRFKRDLLYDDFLLLIAEYGPPRTWYHAGLRVRHPAEALAALKERPSQ